MQAFRREMDEDGIVTFAGPRVRMGLHLAAAGTFEVTRNSMTSKPQLSGPGWEEARLLGDVGSGGQVSR